MVRGLRSLPRIMGIPHGTLPIRHAPDLWAATTIHSSLLRVYFHDHILCRGGESAFSSRALSTMHARGCAAFPLHSFMNISCKSSRLVQVWPRSIRLSLTSPLLCSSDQRSLPSSRLSSSCWRWCGTSSATSRWGVPGYASQLGSEVEESQLG